MNKKDKFYVGITAFIAVCIIFGGFFVIDRAHENKMTILANEAKEFEKKQEIDKENALKEEKEKIELRRKEVEETEAYLLTVVDSYVSPEEFMNSDEFILLGEDSQPFYNLQDQNGLFQKPNDFLPEIPCVFGIDVDGNVKHNMDFSQYITGESIFVNQQLGANKNDGMMDTPVKTITAALRLVNSGDKESYIIRVMDDSPLMLGESTFGTIVDKNVAIIPNNNSGRILFTTGRRNLEWIEDQDGTYYTMMEKARAVFDYSYQDENGLYVPYEMVLSVDECRLNAGSWYFDDENVYVHTLDDEMPDEESISVGGISQDNLITLAGTSTLFMKSCDFFGGQGRHGLMITGDSSDKIETEVCLLDCKFTSSNQMNKDIELSQKGDGLHVIDIKNTYLFDCVAGYTKRDCYGYSFEDTPVEIQRECFVLEVNSIGYNAGYTSNSLNNNISNISSGASILRFASIGVGAGIPVADVGGCYSININCDMSEAVNEIGVYYFNKSDIRDGKAILINCKADEHEFGLHSYVETLIYNFQGNVRKRDSIVDMDI